MVAVGERGSLLVLHRSMQGKADGESCSLLQSSQEEGRGRELLTAAMQHAVVAGAGVAHCRCCNAACKGRPAASAAHCRNTSHGGCRRRGSLTVCTEGWQQLLEQLRGAAAASLAIATRRPRKCSEMKATSAVGMLGAVRRDRHETWVLFLSSHAS